MKVLIFIFFISFSTIYGQVGINTTNPQEALHIGGTTGTIRVESLSASYNDYNGGDVNNNGNMSDDKYPLYVDEYGDLTLKLEVLDNSQAGDAFDDTLLPSSSVQLPVNDGDGKVATTIKSYTVTFNRPTLLEIKYNISHKIYFDSSAPYPIIDDLLARRVTNYITVTPDPDLTDNLPNRKYGPCTKSYTSGSTNSVSGPFFNGSTVYIKILEATAETPITYTINFVGEVSSNKKWGFIQESLSTYVEFAIDNDFLFFRIH